MKTNFLVPLLILLLFHLSTSHAQLDLSREVTLKLTNIDLEEAIYQTLESVGENRNQYTVEIEEPKFVTVYDRRVFYLDRANRALIREYVFDQQKRLFKEFVARSPKELDSPVSFDMKRMALDYVLESIAASRQYELSIEGNNIILGAERKISVELVHSNLDPSKERPIIDILCEAHAAFSYSEKFKSFITIRDHSLGSERSTFLPADVSIIELLKNEEKTTEEIKAILCQLYFGASCTTPRRSQSDSEEVKRVRKIFQNLKKEIYSNQAR